MSYIFLAIFNSAVLNAIKLSVDLDKPPVEILEILIRVLHDASLVNFIQELNESMDFTEDLIPHLKMSQDLDNIYLFRALNTVFGKNLQDWTKSNPQNPQYQITLKSEIIRKIRKDTAVYIDIKVPQKLVIQYDPKDQILSFEGGFNPTSKIARGGIYLGELLKIRALSGDEIKATKGEKNLESTISAGFGAHWALKLLGASTSSFLTSIDTLWWYFRILQD